MTNLRMRKFRSLLKPLSNRLGTASMIVLLTTINELRVTLDRAVLTIDLDVLYMLASMIVASLRASTCVCSGWHSWEADVLWEN